MYVDNQTARPIAGYVTSGSLGIAPSGGSGAGSYSSMLPIILSFKNIPLLTAGSPGDVAMMGIPSGISRWFLPGANTSTQSCAGFVILESATGSINAGSVSVFDSPGGGGINLVGTATVLPSLTGNGSRLGNNSVNNGYSSSPTVYIRQTVNAAATGLFSISLIVCPMP